MNPNLDEPAFWIDPGGGDRQSYAELIERLNDGRSAAATIREGEPLRIFTRLIEALLRGVSVTLVDPELTTSEWRRLGVGDPGADEPVAFPASLGLSGTDDLRARLRASQARVYLHTSGTTGTPRRVGQGVGAITRFTRVGAEHDADVWAFAYHPMHFAGLQVFFQAILNRNAMVDVRALQGRGFSDSVEAHGVTHLSATPTFYRRLLAGDPSPMGRVRRITFGGERFDPTLTGEMRRLFPNAKLTNIYASTEAGSLFAADDDVFRIGRENAGTVRIAEDGEVLLHVSLLGEFERALVDGEWFASGDIVERVGDDAFRFLSRRVETINVGGYKVNPHEVEEVIRRVPGVQDVRVHGRANRLTGNVLEAEVVRAPGRDEHALESAIREAAGAVLQPYKVPRVVRFVDAVSITRTGKKARA